MIRADRVCPGCGGAILRSLGPIPANNVFAARQLDRLLSGGELWNCLECHLVFRHPSLSKNELDQLYRSGNNENWPSLVAERTDWKFVSKVISAQPQIRSILDVGCYDGRLLEYLGPNYERMGVEIHPMAAGKARHRGVKVVAEDYAELPLLRIEADAVLAVDVIEHSHDPLRFLGFLASAVRVGGILIIATGNTSAPSWQLMKSRYWYCHIAEHLSFINPSWVSGAALHLGLEVKDTYFFSHADGGSSIKQKIHETSANLVYRFAPRLFAWLRGLGAGGIDIGRYPELALQPPYWMSAKDHMLVVFRKNCIKGIQ